MKKIILISILFAFINNTSINAQTKKKTTAKATVPSLFYLDKAVNDSILKSDIKISEMKSRGGNLKVVSFDISIKINGNYIDFSGAHSEPKESLKLLSDCAAKKGDAFFIDNIMATDGKSEKKYKGFMLYIK